MPAAILVRPNDDFMREVLASSGGDLKKCYQCGTCSTVCELSPEDAPFPRKQMIEAQWGLQDRLISDPSIWLCHNCGQCTTNCPRGARPGDVLNALRRETIKSFAFPASLGRMVSSPTLWPVLFLIPALICLAILLLAPKGAPTQELEFANMFPIPILEVLFFAVSGLVSVAFLISIRRFLAAIRGSGEGGIIPGLLPALGLIATHERFDKCGDGRNRYWGHALMLWGFGGLAVMGTVVGIGSMVGVLHTPLPLLHPLKIFANVCAAIILAGLAFLFADRIGNSRNREASTYFDWFFLWTLGGVVVTGVICEFLRLLQSSIMYPAYFVHLVLILALFLYAPYSKFAHMAFRTIAIAKVEAAKKCAASAGVPASDSIGAG